MTGLWDTAPPPSASAGGVRRSASRRGGLLADRASSRSPKSRGSSATPSGRRPGLGRSGSRARSARSRVSSAGHCYFTLKDERAQLRCMIFRDDRHGDPARAAHGHPRHRSRPARRLRATGHLPALRRQRAAGRARRPGPALRGAQGPAQRRGALRRQPEAALAGLAADDRRRHLAVGRRAPRHAPRHRAALAAGEHRRQRLPRPGRGRRSVDRPRSAPRRSLDRPADRSRRRRRHRGARRRLARGPLGLQRRSPSCAPSRRCPDRSSSASATRPT